MKEKKANWFTNNSWWLFIILLVIDIVLLNFVISNMKLFLKFGVTWDSNWPILVYFILAIAVMLVTFFMMYFLIYLEDYLHDRNKKKIKLFEMFIEKIVLKGGRD
jgi:hypothetical protein